MKKIILTVMAVFVAASEAMAQSTSPERTEARGYCYAEYSSPTGNKMFTLNVDEKSMEDCRKFSWAPFRAMFFLECPDCKVDREDFLTDLSDQLRLIAKGERAGWPYEVKGNLRSWYGGSFSRADALEACRKHAKSSIARIGSKVACIE